MPARRARRAPRRARRAPRRRVAPRRNKLHSVPRGMKASPNQMASVTESIQFIDTLPNITSYRRFALDSFIRASSIAINYKWYKAAKCTWTYTPLYNTFQETTLGTISKPQMYFQMNRTQDSTLGLTQADFLAAGSKPSAFTKNKVISYVPNWCSPGLIAVRRDEQTGLVASIKQVGLQAETGWLSSPIQDPHLAAPSTQPLTSGNQILNDGSVIAPVLPGNVEYNGHVDYCYQERATAAVYTLVLTVKWVFKQPFFNASPTQSEQAYVNASV